MFDSFLRPIVDPPLNALGVAVAQTGVSANALTVSGAVAATGAAVAIAHGSFGIGLGLIALSRLCDGLDGAVARVTKPTDFGGYLDILCDYIFYAAIPVGFALADPANLLPALILLGSFILSSVSFLGYAALAEKRGLKTQAQGKKSFYYMAGLAEGFETIFVFALSCLMPGLFPVIAYAFSAMCIATALGRAIQARIAFRD
ncbi:MAG: CDP-alcohol phosphatidyltransferase family protein [Parvibaculum sp.]|uniref:CDP-alcohol phosphatidyltransferase family protein n=1 Tax=Parvibaculum sp. TaxID=2024848 RepID=UPI0025F6D85E|nr:CDP-alcohol phosphatidyltransferase family protein [Parvibaculum sp.]MCE9649872.1 CDP-alcohol phosphatidyltransferase family protein [Parvibaculum sp.]